MQKMPAVREYEIMNERKRNVLKLLCLIMVLSLAALMTACGSSGEEDHSKRTENEEKVLRAMIEYPGDGLYQPSVVAIGEGTEDLTEEDYAAEEQKSAEEKQAWAAAIGDCFAEGMFDTFYSKWYRTYVIGIAYSARLTTTMTGFSVEDDDGTDNLEHVITSILFEDEYGNSMSFDMDWRVKADREDGNLLQSIELIDDGGLWDTITNYSEDL